MSDANLIAQYDANIPPADRETAARLDALDTELMRGALEERYAPKARLKQILEVTTAYCSYFTARYHKWKAILDNREAEAYVQRRAQTEARGEKFVSAAAEREAAYEVRELRYLVHFYEANVERCEQYINTCKRLLEIFQLEDRTT